MATSSPRLGLSRFADGEDNWDHTDTVNLVDEFAVQRDTKASRPASGTYQDELFHAVDEGSLYRYEGSGSWSGAVTSLRDSNESELVRLNAGGPVEVLNAHLNLNGSNITSVNAITTHDDNFYFQTSGTGTGYWFVNDKANGVRKFQVNEGGPVEVTNANLQLPVGNNINDSNGQRRFGGYSSATFIFSDGTGTGSVTLRDDANSQNLFVANEGGPVEVLNAKLDVGVGQIRSNGNAWMLRTGSTNEEHIQYTWGGAGTGAWKVRGEGSGGYTDWFRVNEDGPVEVLNANLNVGNNQIRDIDANFFTTSTQTDAISLYGGTSSVVLKDEVNNQALMEWNEGGPVEVLNSHLSVGANNNITFNGYDGGGIDDAITWPNQGGGQKAYISENVNGEIKAEDDAGNSTTLT